MTVEQAVKLVDTLEPNGYSRDLKVRWLSALDGRIFREVLQQHADCPVEDFEGYAHAHGSTCLLVPFPYDEDVYSCYLQSRIALENGEAARYNRAVTLFNSAFQAFEKDYRRSHRPVSRGQFHL